MCNSKQLCNEEGMTYLLGCKQSPTSLKQEVANGFIYTWVVFIGKRPFGGAQEQNHEGLSPKWTISYQCEDMCMW